MFKKCPKNPLLRRMKLLNRFFFELYAFIILTSTAKQVVVCLHKPSSGSCVTAEN